MIYIFLGIQLLIILCMSLFYNHKKLYMRGSNIYIVSFLEGFGAFLIITSLFLEGFIVNPLLQVFLFLIGAFFVVYSDSSFNDPQPDVETELESLKNIMVTYASTILFFYVTLTIFRFQPFYIQISLSIIIVILFNVLAKYLKQWFTNVWDRFSFNSSMFVNFNVVYLFIAFFGVFLIIMTFNFPKVAVNQFLNTNNSNTYYAYPNGSNILINRYQENKVFETNTDLDIDINAYMNHRDDYVFIYIDFEMIVVDLSQNNIVYSGPHIDQYNGVMIPSINEETNEAKYKTQCITDDECFEYDYPFIYGNVKYRTIDEIYRFDQLSYDHSDIGIFTDDIIHLFDEDTIDSRVSTIQERPFIGLADSQAKITDIDNKDGIISYLLLEQKEDGLNIQIIDIIEKDIDIELPFYSHYRFGIILVIMLIGFIPITNYDANRH